jgi:hypothetical protein
MKQLYDITPPPELRQLWAQQAQRMNPRDPIAWQEHIANQAAQWGAGQELEAMLAELKALHLPDDYVVAAKLRAARRPKPPSLKEEALKALTAIEGDFNTVGDRADTIRRALEALDD